MKENWNYAPGHLEEFADNLGAFIAPINLHDDFLVYSLALTPKTRREDEIGPVLVLHSKELRCNWLKLLNRSITCFNVSVVIMTLLFDPVQAFFECVLPVSNETRIL